MANLTDPNEIQRQLAAMQKIKEAKTPEEIAAAAKPPPAPVRPNESALAAQQREQAAASTKALNERELRQYSFNPFNKEPIFRHEEDMGRSVLPASSQAASAGLQWNNQKDRLLSGPMSPLEYEKEIPKRSVLEQASAPFGLESTGYRSGPRELDYGGQKIYASVGADGETTYSGVGNLSGQVAPGLSPQGAGSSKVLQDMSPEAQLSRMNALNPQKTTLNTSETVGNGGSPESGYAKDIRMREYKMAVDGLKQDMERGRVSAGKGAVLMGAINKMYAEPETTTARSAAQVAPPPGLEMPEEEKKKRKVLAKVKWPAKPGEEQGQEFSAVWDQDREELSTPKWNREETAVMAEAARQQALKDEAAKAEKEKKNRGSSFWPFGK